MKFQQLLFHWFNWNTWGEWWNGWKIYPWWFFPHQMLVGLPTCTCTRSLHCSECCLFCVFLEVSVYHTCTAPYTVPLFLLASRGYAHFLLFGQGHIFALATKSMLEIDPTGQYDLHEYTTCATTVSVDGQLHDVAGQSLHLKRLLSVAEMCTPSSPRFFSVGDVHVCLHVTPWWQRENCNTTLDFLIFFF